MTTLPTTIVAGDSSHISHHNVLHAWYNLATTKGDLIVVTGAQAYARLAAGADGTVLEADSTQTAGVKWGAAKIAATVGTTKGDLIGFTGSATPVRFGVGTDGSLLVADSGQASGLRYALPQGANLAALGESTTSVAYVDLATPGPAVTVTVGASGKALVIVSVVNIGVVAEAGYASYAVSGATTVAAADTGASYAQVVSGANIGGSRATVATGLTAGLNTFTMKYRSSGGAVVYFTHRTIMVIPL